MNAFGLAAVVVVCLTVLAVGHAARGIVDRTLKVFERKYAPTPAVPIPPDLQTRVTAFGDEWAQLNEAQRLRELYGDLGSWEAVRVAIREERPRVIGRELVT